MANGWTPERRARQAALIQTWQPWKRSTGPKTEQGKAIVSQNAIVHGLRAADWVTERKRFNDFMRGVREHIRSRQ